MSTDDYFDDDEDDLGGYEGGEGEGPETPEGAAASKPGFKDWINRRRGWLLVIALALAQGLFALIMMFMRADARPAGSDAIRTVEDQAIDALGHEVAFSDIYYYLPAPGGRRISLNMNLVLNLGQLPQELVEGAERPTDAEYELFISAVQQMEPRIRDRLNMLVQTTPTDELATPEANARIREDLTDYINDMLESLDFGRGMRKNIDKRRVTDIYITNLRQ